MKRQKSRQKNSRKSRAKSSAGKILLALGALFAALAVFAFFATLPDVHVLKTSYPVIHYRGPEQPPLVTFQKSRPRGWVSLGDISRISVDAILISEDSDFYRNHGFDLDQIKQAAQEDWERRSFARGASTITQQVARNVFLSKDKNLWRKARELYLAVKLDQAISKRRVLETYLNIAEWGPGIFGIREAASYYFGKDPTQLGAKEGAFLAMLLPSPIRYGQSFRQHRLTEYANATIDDLLEKMAQVHELTDEAKSAELNRPLSFESGESGGTVIAPL